MGFEPTVPSGITGFQDQLHKPLGHLSMRFSCFLLSSDLDYYILPSIGCQELFYSFLNLFSATASSCFRVARGDIDITGKFEKCQPLFSIFFNFFQIIFLTLYIMKIKPVHMVFLPKPCYNMIRFIYSERSIYYETRFRTFFNICKTPHYF